MKDIKRIMLTGGPCSGKTTALAKIGDCAFTGCTGLTSITLPNSVTRIGWKAFDCCDELKSVTLPRSLDKIGVEAFPEWTEIISK